MGLTVAKTTMSGGSTSGTPPTFVATVSRPHAAASRMAMQKASVREQLRNSCPRTSTSLTSSCLTSPSSSTLSYSMCFSTISSTCSLLGPSPPMMKYNSGSLAAISATTSTRRSTPFRYTRRVMATTVVRFAQE